MSSSPLPAAAAPAVVAALALALASCGGSGEAAPPPGDQPAPARALVEAARWPVAAVPLGWAGDGDRWIGAAWPDAVVYDDRGREVDRLSGAVVAGRDDIAPLRGGRTRVGRRVLAADGTVRFDAAALGHRQGRFGHVVAFDVDPAGRTAIVVASDARSTCACERERGDPGPLRGQVIRVALDAERDGERVLDDDAGGLEAHVAAGPRHVAVVSGRTLRVWPARGDAPAVTANLDPMVRHLAWTDEGDALVAVRYLDVDHGEVIVLDAGDLAVRARWRFDGSLQAFALRPRTDELALGTVPQPFHGDGAAVAVFGLDGDLRARAALDGIPASLSWHPDGGSLLVALTRIAPRTPDVVRLDVR